MRSGTVDSPARTRTVWGTIGTSGAVISSGSNDWTVTRSAVGQYTIRFVKPFAGVPAIALQCWTPQGMSYLSGVAADAISIVWSAASAGGGVDTSFEFTATGRVTT